MPALLKPLTSSVPSSSLSCRCPPLCYWAQVFSQRLLASPGWSQHRSHRLEASFLAEGRPQPQAVNGHNQPAVWVKTMGTVSDSWGPSAPPWPSSPAAPSVPSLPLPTFPTTPHDHSGQSHHDRKPGHSLSHLAACPGSLQFYPMVIYLPFYH